MARFALAPVFAAWCSRVVVAELAGCRAAIPLAALGTFAAMASRFVVATVSCARSFNGAAVGDSVGDYVEGVSKPAASRIGRRHVP